MIAALEEERRGYVLRGLTDRVALVDAEIAKFRAAAEVETPDGPADVETAVVKPAKKK